MLRSDSIANASTELAVQILRDHFQCNYVRGWGAKVLQYLRVRGNHVCVCFSVLKKVLKIFYFWQIFLWGYNHWPRHNLRLSNSCHGEIRFGKVSYKYYFLKGLGQFSPKITEEDDEDIEERTTIDDDDDLCFDAQFVENVCKIHPLRLIKTVRLRVHQSYDLLNTDPRLKIILLVRDPRAVRSSRLKRNWCNFPACNSVHRWVKNI